VLPIWNSLQNASRKQPSRLRACSLWTVALAAFLAPAGVVRAQDGKPGDGDGGRKGKSLIDYVRDGGMIGHSIIVCSVVGVSLSITYAFQIRRDVLAPPEVLGQLEQLFDEEAYEEAHQVCASNPSFLSSVVSKGLEKREEGWGAMEAAMQEAGDTEAAKLQVKISYLSLIGAISPMLGLFGTVSGMIVTFDVIATSEVQPKPSDLATGISQALVTTYEGLVVAIPMIVLFNVFRNRITTLLMDVSSATEALMDRFKRTSQAS